MKIILVTLLLCGCAPLNTQNLTYEQRMQLFDRMRLQPHQVQFYPMQIPQYTPCGGCR